MAEYSGSIHPADEGGTFSPATMVEQSPPEFCVMKSPMNGQFAVTRPGEGGTAGWQRLHGPDTSDGCWKWIQKKSRPGLRF